MQPPSPKKPPLPERKFIGTFQALIFRVFSCWFRNSGIRNALQATQTQKMFRKRLKLQGTNQVTLIFIMACQKTARKKKHNISNLKSPYPSFHNHGSVENGSLQF